MANQKPEFSRRLTVTLFHQQDNTSVYLLSPADDQVAPGNKRYDIDNDLEHFYPWIDARQSSPDDRFVLRRVRSKHESLPVYLWKRLLNTSADHKARSLQFFDRYLRKRLQEENLVVDQEFRFHGTNKRFRRFPFLTSSYQISNLMPFVGEPDFYQYKRIERIPILDAVKLARALGKLHLTLAGSGAPASATPVNGVHAETQLRLVDRFFGFGVARFRKLARTKKVNWKLVELLNDGKVLEMLQRLKKFSPMRSKYRSDHGLFKTRSLIHGDCHSQNLFLSHSCDRTYFFDWEMCGLGFPTMELANLLCGSTATTAGFNDRIIQEYCKARKISSDAERTAIQKEFTLATLQLAKLTMLLPLLNGRAQRIVNRTLFRHLLRSLEIFESGTVDGFAR